MKMNKKVAACVGLGVAAVVGGTFAYYNQTTSLENPLITGSYSNQLVEEFTPPADELKPGQKWDKKVGAENTGDYPVLVRIKMGEKWTLKDGKPVELESTDAGFNSGEYDPETGIFDANQNNDKDGSTDGDETVVHKIMNVAPDSFWIQGTDGYWYWNNVLGTKRSGSSSTDNLMEALVLATDIDLGVYEEKEWYAIAAKGTNASEIPETEWTEVPDGKTILDIAEEEKEKLTSNMTIFRKSVSTLDEENAGYADAGYVLTVTADFVQATPDAVKAAWCTDDEGEYHEDVYAELLEDLTNVYEDGSLLSSRVR